jgi:VWFA-related protein
METNQARTDSALSRAIKFGVLVVLLSAMVSGQGIQLRSRVELVVVPVSVKGNNNKLAPGLSLADFTISEAGKKQTITSFSIDPVPISAAILIDTGISEPALTRVKNSFPALLGAFAGDDELILYRFDKHVEKLTDFSIDRLQIETALDKLTSATPSSYSMGGGPFSASGLIINGTPITPGVQPVSRSSTTPSKVLHDAVFAAAEELGTRPIDRRRILMIASDGRNQNSKNSFDGALERLLVHGVQVFSYGVDTSVFQRIGSNLTSYARATGGESWFPESQGRLEECYSLSTETARNQYVLGYESTNKRPASRAVFREIQVTVNQRGFEVRHRKGYYQSP